MFYFATFIFYMQLLATLNQISNDHVRYCYHFVFFVVVCLSFFFVDLNSKMATIVLGKNKNYFFLRNQKFDWTQTEHNQSLDGSLQNFIFCINRKSKMVDATG
jgi:hypothetical protein